MIDDIKTELERRCPRTVSCADILTAAARDATILAGGPFWEVPFGRRDGRVSIAREATLVPHGHENITALLGFFQHLGLDILDLVTLSGRKGLASWKPILFDLNHILFDCIWAWS